tara:strand:+ start:8960 stop:9325 length:366 start_codon:yes stop_codon:yes gene_type:complete
MPKGRKKTFEQKLIEKLVICPHPSSPGPELNSFWGREMKILKSVLQQFPNKDFWEKVTFEKKFKSLATILGDVGKIFIKRKYSEFHYKPKKIVMPEIYDEKFGEDLEVEKKKRSVKDYFNE